MMERMQPLPINQLDDDIRHMCEESEKQVGTSASTRTYARNPAGVKALAAFRAAPARAGTIHPATRTLVRIKSADLNVWGDCFKAAYDGACEPAVNEKR